MKIIESKDLKPLDKIITLSKSIEELYNCEVHIKHTSEDKYIINVIDITSKSIYGILPKSDDKTVIKYLYGIIDAYRLIKTK